MPPIDIKSWPWGPTFDSSDPLDSDQGRIRMHRINLKSPGLGGGDFRFIRSIRCGPGSESNESNEFKVLAWGPTLESLASVYAFDAEAPEGGLVEPESKVLGATFDALDSVDSDQGPSRMNLMHLKVAPRTFDSDTHPRFRCLCT